MPRNDGSLQTTKQMLDELDALMEKMLALPVNDPDDAPAFPQEIVKAPTLTPTLSATLTLLEPPAKHPVGEPTAITPLTAPTDSHPAVNPPHLTFSMEPEKETLAYEPVPQPEPLTNDVTPPSVRPRLEPLLAEFSEPMPALSTQWGYLPLLWINQAFDQTTMLLGGGGLWLRSQAGRMVLGLVGIAALLAAGAWFLRDWLGWN